MSLSQKRGGMYNMCVCTAVYEWGKLAYICFEFKKLHCWYRMIRIDVLKAINIKWIFNFKLIIFAQFFKCLCYLIFINFIPMVRILFWLNVVVFLFSNSRCLVSDVKSYVLNFRFPCIISSQSYFCSRNMIEGMLLYLILNSNKFNKS